MVLGYPINSSGKLERKSNCRAKKDPIQEGFAHSIRSHARLVDSEWSASDKPEVGRGLTTRARQSRTSVVALFTLLRFSFAIARLVLLASGEA